MRNFIVGYMLGAKLCVSWPIGSSRINRKNWAKSAFAAPLEGEAKGISVCQAALGDLKAHGQVMYELD
jgi:hypothetical protein